MGSVIFIDTFAEAWRQFQAEPIRAFCHCEHNARGRGCVQRRARIRRGRTRSRRRHARVVTRGKSADPDPDGPPRGRHFRHFHQQQHAPRGA